MNTNHAVESSDVAEDAASGSGWNACTECLEWMPGDQLVDQGDGRLVCIPCLRPQYFDLAMQYVYEA